MEWAGLRGNRIAADYEFLFGRHPQYFKSQEEARAAVEMVLSKPEKMKDIVKNLSFAGIDEDTGTIYRIEIDPTVKNKFNYVRSVFEITASQYEKDKLAGFPVLQPSPTEDNQSAGRTLASFLRYNNTTFENVKSESENYRFLLAEFSPEERRDITLLLKPFVGYNVSRTDAEYQSYLAELGIEVSEKDAHAFAVTAARENVQDNNQRTADKRKAAREAADKRREQYLYETIPLYREAWEFAGSSDFKIKLELFLLLQHLNN